MGALKIDCYCNEKQMSNIIKTVTTHLYDSDRSEVTDIDDMIDDVRFCVEFETYMDTVRLKSSEVLDEDWGVLYEDTAVLTSRLRNVLSDFNRNDKDARRQAREIRRDQYAYCG